MIKLYLKLIVFRMLAWLPGKVGETSETRYLWAARKIRVRSAADDFETELARLTPSSVCIDLGANIGQITQQLAERCGHVHAFEPDPWAFAKLQEATRHCRNLTLYHQAAGAVDKIVQFQQDPDFKNNPEMHSQGTSIYRSVIWDKSKSAFTFDAEMIDFKRFIRSLGERIHVLKVDIEGGEVDLLEHMIGSEEWRLIDAVFVETHECQIPELRHRIAKLRKQLKHSTRPRVYLNWQ